MPVMFVTHCSNLGVMPVNHCGNLVCVMSVNHCCLVRSVCTAGFFSKIWLNNVCRFVCV